MSSGWAMAANIAADFASVASLAFVGWQLRSLARQTKASTDAVQATAHLQTFTSAVGIDQFFVDHPDLRRHFYGHLDGAEEQKELQRIDATAEMLLDQFMMAATQIEHMSPELKQGWKRYVTHVVDRSPALQDFLDRNDDWYDLREHLAPARTAAPARGRRWRERSIRRVRGAHEARAA